MDMENSNEHMRRGAAGCAPTCISPIAQIITRAGIAFLMLVSVGSPAATAQTRASLGVGVGSVRSETGSSFSSGSLSPTIRFATPGFVTQLSGFGAALPNGAWSGAGNLHLWGATPRVIGPLRFGAEGIVEGTTRRGGAWTSAAHGLGELLWSGPGWGFGLGAGPSAGWIVNDPSVVALHTRGRVWWRPGGSAGATYVQLSVEPTRFFGQWFTDVGAGFTVRQGPVGLSLSTDARLSQVYGSTAAGSGFLQLFLGPVLSLELGGGSYLREPYQGFPRGSFFRLGLRMGSMRPRAATPTRAATPKRLGPLVPLVRGDSLVVQFRFRDVHTVAIAGNWDAWQTHALRRVGGDLWQGTFALTRGVYHFNLLVNGRSWVVPSGVTTVPDGLGGKVAVLLVR
jgi:hypothetical protein